MSEIINSHLKEGFDLIAPDCFEQIMKATPVRIETEEELFCMLPEYQMNKPPKKGRIMKLLAPAMAAMICFSTYTYYGNHHITDHIYVDVNPSVAIALNKHETVVKVEGLNEDGQHVLEEISEELKELKSMKATLKTILTELEEENYFAEEADLILSHGYDDQPDRELLSKANAVVERFMSTNEIEATWVVQSFEEDDELTEAAKANKVSVSKYQFLNQFSVGDTTKDTLYQTPVKEIYNWLETHAEKCSGTFYHYSSEDGMDVSMPSYADEKTDLTDLMNKGKEALDQIGTAGSALSAQKQLPDLETLVKSMPSLMKQYNLDMYVDSKLLPNISEETMEQWTKLLSQYLDGNLSDISVDNYWNYVNPYLPEDFKIPEGYTLPEGYVMPDDFNWEDYLPEGVTLPEDFKFPDKNMSNNNSNLDSSIEIPEVPEIDAQAESLEEIPDVVAQLDPELQP